MQQKRQLYKGIVAGALVAAVGLTVAFIVTMKRSASDLVSDMVDPKGAEALPASASVSASRAKSAEPEPIRGAGAIWSVRPRDAAPEATQSAAPEGAMTTVTVVAKPLAPLTAEAKAAKREIFAQKRLVMRGLLTTAKSAARDERSCGKGDAKACERLTKDGKDRREELGKVKERLAADCGKEQLDACVHRGDLELVGVATAASREWYDKARALAEATKKRCVSGDETSARLCQRAERTVTLLQKRVAKLETAH